MARPGRRRAAGRALLLLPDDAYHPAEGPGARCGWTSIAGPSSASGSWPGRAGAVLVKPHPQQNFRSERTRIGKEVGELLDRDVFLVRADEDARRLIVTSDVVVGFQSTALLEGMLVGRPVVYTGWDIESSRLAAELIPFPEWAEVISSSRSRRHWRRRSKPRSSRTRHLRSGPAARNRDRVSGALRRSGIEANARRDPSVRRIVRGPPGCSDPVTPRGARGAAAARPRPPEDPPGFRPPASGRRRGARPVSGSWGTGIRERLGALGNTHSRGEGGPLDDVLARLRRPLDRAYLQHNGKLSSLYQLGRSAQGIPAPAAVRERVLVLHSAAGRTCAYESVIAHALALRGAEVGLLAAVAASRSASSVVEAGVSEALRPVCPLLQPDP